MDPRPSRLNTPRATTTAAVWRGGDQVDLVAVPLPDLETGQALVRVRLATVCGSDLHTVSGRRGGPCPSVLGHEAVGEVVSSRGARTIDGAPLRVGDPVVWGVAVSCGSCDRCVSGRTAKCRTVRKFGHEPFESDWPLSGGYAEHVLLPAGSAIAVVPPGLPDPVAAPAACATATVLAVMEAAGPLAELRVLVCGAGMLGLTATAYAASSGAAEVVVVDVDPDRLAWARRFGATQVVLAGSEIPGVDVALEFSGAATSVSSALDALDIGGVLVLAGSVAPGPAVPLDPERVVRRWLRVAGVHNYEPRHLVEALDFLAATAETRPWADLVSEAAPLSEIGRLLTDHHRREPRAAVTP